MPERRLPDWPRVLGQENAAAYVGLSATAFREHVVPSVPPIWITPGRKGWLREDLDRWIDARAGRTSDGDVDWATA